VPHHAHHRRIQDRAIPATFETASLFDLDIAGFSKLVWDVTLPIEEKPWNIGLITGTSGCGKSTIAARCHRV